MEDEARPCGGCSKADSERIFHGRCMECGDVVDAAAASGYYLVGDAFLSPKVADDEEAAIGDPGVLGLPDPDAPATERGWTGRVLEPEEQFPA